MKRRTTIDLDYDLVAEASAVLGTKRISETVHRAMDEVIARRQRGELARMPMPDLTPQAIAWMRAPRTLEDREGQAVPTDDHGAG